MDHEQIVPDQESYLNIERLYPNESSAQKYRLMQADTLLRQSKAAHSEPEPTTVLRRLLHKSD